MPHFIRTRPDAWLRFVHAHRHESPPPCMVWVSLHFNTPWLQGSCVSMHPGYKVPAFQCILVIRPCVSMHPGYNVRAFQCVLVTTSLRFNASCLQGPCVSMRPGYKVPAFQCVPIYACMVHTASPGMYHMVSSSPYNILCRKKENSAGGEITLHKGPPYPQSDP